jgi:hypothetical protein
MSMASPRTDCAPAIASLSARGDLVRLAPRPTTDRPRIRARWGMHRGSVRHRLRTQSPPTRDPRPRPPVSLEDDRRRCHLAVRRLECVLRRKTRRLAEGGARAALAMASLEGIRRRRWASNDWTGHSPRLSILSVASTSTSSGRASTAAAAGLHEQACNTIVVTKKESTGGVLHRESEQLHGLLQRLREHLKEVQDSAFELVAALSFATVFVSGMFSVDAFTTVPEALWPRRSRYAGRGPPMGLEQVASRSPF